MKIVQQKWPTEVTIQDCINATKIPLKNWAGNCYGVAEAIVKSGLVRGTPVYGMWTGRIATTSIFANRIKLGFTHHGWITLPNGKVMDPTRWVFEDVKPYIFVGEKEYSCFDFQASDTPEVCLCGHVIEEHKHGFFQPCTICHWPYDEGGNETREKFRQPCPKFDPKKKAYHLTLSEKARQVVSMVVGRDSPYSIEQLLWLANAPWENLNGQAFEIYQAIEKAGGIGFIPIDNKMRAQREHQSKKIQKKP